MGASTSKVKYKPGTPLSAIQSQIQPLDLIVFRGDGLVADAISMAEKWKFNSGEWTHMAMVITTDLVPIKNGKPGQLYIWESTMSLHSGNGINSVETGKGDFGVQIRNLADVVDKYDSSAESRIGWCQLVNNPIKRRDEDSDQEYNNRLESVRQILTQFYYSRGDATYDYNLCRLCSTVCENSNSSRGCGILDICGRSDNLFCSELIVILYQLLGLLPAEIDPEKIAPEELLGNLHPESQPLRSPVKLPPVVITREWSKSKRVYL